MRIFLPILFCKLVGGAAATNNNHKDQETRIVLEAFDEPIHAWQEMNDPVMGGQSTGTFQIEEGLGKFRGEVVDVPFLKAPGFIKATASGKFPDVSSCDALQVEAQSRTQPPYDGYRISFGNPRAPGGKFFAYGYKANLPILTTGGDGVAAVVTIPFSNFTDFWDDATGDAIHTCHENHLYCPDSKTLQNMKHLTIWGEGVAGKVDLEIKSIYAVGCDDTFSS